MIELILGGARSGKTRYAEKQAESSGLTCFYLATGQAHDGEMQIRINQHKTNRNSHWQTIEEPLALGLTLQQHSHANHCILIDCLTLWLTNALHHQCWQEEKQTLMDTLTTLPGRIIMVSNEVGTGIIPMGELTRKFVDESGLLHQQIAALCNRVTLVTAGLPMILKGN